MLSIIIPARNGFEGTLMCLNSVLYSVSRLNLTCEFILVDDASQTSDRILDAFRQHRGNAKGHETRIIRSRKHQHYSGVFSIGLQFATRDVIVFISNDMLVPPSFIQGLLLVSSLSPEFGIVRGVSNYVDSHPEHCVQLPERPKHFRDVDEFARGVFNTAGCAFVEDRILSGDAILLKRELVNRIGVLDLRFFGYFGDIDYGMRAHLAGFKLICAKGAWLFHEGSGHVKQEIASLGLTVDEARDRRMAMVEAAYREFRKKWRLDELPEQWNAGINLPSLDFIELARGHAANVPVKCELPMQVLDDLEII